MKNKSKKWYLKYNGVITFLVYLTFYLCAYINRHLSVCLLLMLLCSLWAILMYWMQSRINDKLEHRNAELMKWNADLSKQCTTYRIISQFYLYKHLNAQNDVDFCKRKINCTKYLERREYYERMIEFFVKDIKAKEMQ